MVTKASEKTVGSPEAARRFVFRLKRRVANFFIDKGTNPNDPRGNRTQTPGADLAAVFQKELTGLEADEKQRRGARKRKKERKREKAEEASGKENTGVRPGKNTIATSDEGAKQALTAANETQDSSLLNRTRAQRRRRFLA